MDKDSAAFQEQVTEAEGRIQQYLDFNAQLLVSIAAYREAVAQSVSQVTTTIEQQQAEIEALEQELEELNTGDEE